MNMKKAMQPAGLSLPNHAHPWPSSTATVASPRSPKTPTRQAQLHEPKPPNVKHHRSSSEFIGVHRTLFLFSRPSSVRSLPKPGALRPDFRLRTSDFFRTSAFGLRI